METVTVNIELGTPRGLTDMWSCVTLVRMQEIDFEFEFNGDKTLRDVLVYKREVKEFKVNRP